jgi:hypothetical protein
MFILTILGCLIVKWPFLGINMFNTIYLDNEKELAFQKYINQFK